mmetsp:Transcript_14792/g.28020  ORF Transcript_14792/g.28020 Transcript_14792/m.28020 type:complete len:425 (+) Transcript_14792:42-1316(+)
MPDNAEEDNEDTCEMIIGCWPFRRRQRNKQQRNLLETTRTPATSTPALQRRSPPRLVSIRRESSPLLNACWQQNWNAVLSYLDTDQIYHRSHNSGRQALHFACMPAAQCPMGVLRAILNANPYAVVTEDYHQYGGTPLHFCCGSKLREQSSLVKEMVDTAIQVQAECAHEHIHIRLSYWSPLYQAAKWAAPPATLYILVQASHVQPWIAPWTGAESWNRADQIRRTSLAPARDSPLRALWRRSTPKRLISIHGLPIAMMRQLTLDYYAAADPWEFCLSKQELWKANPDISHFAKVLVLLRDQTTSVDQLLQTAVSLYASIPALVRLLTVLWPEQLMLPSQENNDRLPVHVGVARYAAASLGAEAEAAQVLEILALSQPQALLVPDLVTGLPPALHVAPHAASVDLIYTLLRPVPTLVPTVGYTG